MKILGEKVYKNHYLKSDMLMLYYCSYKSDNQQ